MKAIIFAAGNGTRLKPLTNNKPKALVEVNSVPLLEIVIQKLILSGVTEIIINVHYLANQIIEFLESKNNFGINIKISDETKKLLDTGGGLKKASWFFNSNEPFIVYNTDVINNIDLKQMMEFHISNKAIATLAVRKRISSRYFLFNDNNELCGWKNNASNKEILIKQSTKFIELGFSGIHIINPRIFKFMPSKDRFSIVEIYLELAKKYKIKGFEHNLSFWFDIGNLRKLNEADSFLKSG